MTIPGPTADQAKAAVNTIVDEVNADGGIAGRKVVPLFDIRSYVTSPNWESDAQAQCEYFTTDNKVFAVLAGINNQSTLLPQCLGRHNTVMMDGTNSVYFDDTELTPFKRTYYRATGLPFTKWGPAYVDQLVGLKLLTKASKVGIVRYDVPPQARTVKNIIRPALARRGIAVADEVAFRALNTSGGLGGMAAEAGNAVLRFRGAGIDRVLFVASQSPAPFTFMTAAQNQGYNPRYGLTSSDLPQFLADNIGSSQLRGAVGAGWLRGADVPSQRWPESPNWARCARIMAKKGYTDPLYGFGCDAFWFLQLVLSKTTNVSPARMRSVVDGLGAAFTYASSWAHRWTPGRTHGASGVRGLRFDEACVCFKYATPVIDVG